MSDQPKYKNPIWIKKEIRSLECDILVGDEYQHCIVNAGPADEGYVNKDFDAIMELIGEEEIDRLTAIEDEKKAEAEKKKKEQAEVHKNRVKQEALFEMKLEAFGIPLINDSKNSELKKSIRRAKTIVEVQAYSTILIQKELENSNLRELLSDD
tara:strand:- start:1270 stop:1731 length:462 start_codon:yes stop_codon:yes gene_type:complete